MSDSQTSVNGLSRPFYQDGQMLDAVDFTDEQNYFIQLIRLHTQAFHTRGIASGLVVQNPRWDSTQGWLIDVTAGVGIDDLGDHAVLTSTYTVTLPCASVLQTNTRIVPLSQTDLPASMTVLAAYTLNQSVSTSQTPRMRTNETTEIFFSVLMKQSDGSLIQRFVDGQGNDLSSTPPAALRFIIATVTANSDPTQPPVITLTNAEYSQARGTTTSTNITIPSYTSGTGVLANGMATVSISNWPALQSAFQSAIPRVWPFIDGSAITTGAKVSALVASRINNLGQFQVMGIDQNNLTQAFAWEIQAL
jgi:hypothetical protein